MKKRKATTPSSSRKARRPASRPATPKTVEEYLARVPEPARSTLEKIRAVIRAAAPEEAVEVISYGIPMFKYKGMLASYAAFSKHCSLFPGKHPIRALRDELQGYAVVGSTIRFPGDRPLPASLVKKLVRARIAENEGSL